MGKIEDMTCIMSEIPQYKKNPSGKKIRDMTYKLVLILPH